MIFLEIVEYLISRYWENVGLYRDYINLYTLTICRAVIVMKNVGVVIYIKFLNNTIVWYPSPKGIYKKLEQRLVIDINFIAGVATELEIKYSQLRKIRFLVLWRHLQCHYFYVLLCLTLSLSVFISLSYHYFHLLR